MGVGKSQRAMEIHNARLSCRAGTSVLGVQGDSLRQPGIGSFRRQPEPDSRRRRIISISAPSSIRYRTGITLDHYRILLKNPIGTIPGTAIYGIRRVRERDTNERGRVADSVDLLGPDCTPYTRRPAVTFTRKRPNTGHHDRRCRSERELYATQPDRPFNEDLEGTAITQFDLQEYTGGPALNLVGWYNSGNQPALRWQHNLADHLDEPGRQWGAGLNNRFMSTYIDRERRCRGESEDRGQRFDLGRLRLLRADLPADRTGWNSQSLQQVAAILQPAGNWRAGYNPVYSNPILRNFYLNLKYDF